MAEVRRITRKYVVVRQEFFHVDQFSIQLPGTCVQFVQLASEAFILGNQSCFVWYYCHVEARSMKKGSAEPSAAPRTPGKGRSETAQGRRSLLGNGPTCCLHCQEPNGSGCRFSGKQHGHPRRPIKLSIHILYPEAKHYKQPRSWQRKCSRRTPAVVS